MTTRAQIMRLLAMLASNYGDTRAKVTSEKISLWHGMFGNFRFADLARSVAEHMAESKWPPTIAEVRSRLVRVTFPGLDVALGEMERATRGERFDFSAPQIAQAYNALGLGRGVVLSSQMGTIRAQFRDAYEAACARAQNEASIAALPSAVGQQQLTKKESIC